MEKEKEIDNSNVLIITALQGYTVDDIRPWIESLSKCGYTGNVLAFKYDNNKEVEEYLKSYGVSIYQGVPNGINHVATQRFADYSVALANEALNHIEYVLHTDIRDVVFQEDPTTWIENGLEKHQILVSAEGIKYNHEDWNGDGLQKHFGKEMFDEFKNYETLCSGVIAGRKEAITELFITIFEMSFFSGAPDGFNDQHFHNIAIRKVFKDVTNCPPADAPWTANLGTLIAIPMNDVNWSSSPRTPYNSYERFRKGTFVENMLVELPKMINGKVCTSSGTPYAIVHQYDRYQPWKDEILKNLNIDFTEKTLGFYMWAYDNVENVDYVFESLRKAYPTSDLVISSDNGEDFTEIANKYNAVKYIHGTESHGYPHTKERYGWTAEQAKLWLDRFYEACKNVSTDYIMMMDEDVLVKSSFKIENYDIIMTPNIHNRISNVGMKWIESRDGRVDYPFYSFGGGSIIKVSSFIKAYENHQEDYFNNYETIFQESFKEGIVSWGWNDCMICALMYADNATFSTTLPVSETGNEEDPMPIIHKFKKYYRNQAIPA